MFDKDGDGTISMEELASVMQIIGLHPTQDELEIMLASVDTDRNGVIDFDEFVDLMAGHLKDENSDDRSVFNDDELREAFAVFDRDGNGMITAEELKGALLSLGERLTDEEVAAMIVAADRDGNGVIDYREFILLMKDI